MHTKWIYVDTKHQQLFLYEGDAVIATYSVSTSKNGLGEIQGSERTPRGWHCIEKKIGDGVEINTVFVGRVPTGDVYTLDLAAQHPTRDWILTRILWLSGLEEGKNKGGNVDTFSRYIYIHGFPDHIPIDRPLSHGCVRMRNVDVLVLFGTVPDKTRVFIGDELPSNVKEYLG